MQIGEPLLSCKEREAGRWVPLQRASRPRGPPSGRPPARQQLLCKQEERDSVTTQHSPVDSEPLRTDPGLWPPHMLLLQGRHVPPGLMLVNANGVQYISHPPFHENKKRNKYFAAHKDNKRNLLTKELRDPALGTSSVLQFVAF